ncbi:MAG: ThuA domain-containing protein [Oscillospiraceae bacterium]|nr:ThuA domain-containing protein [Oscillospiraceae bacterium]
MKKSVLVIWHDRWHPDTTYEAMINELFGDWDLKTDKSMLTLSRAEKAPDFAIVLSAAMQQEESLSDEDQAAICRMADNGMGMLYIHAGLTRIKEGTPIYGLTHARFIMHPQGQPPVYNCDMPGVGHPIMAGVEPFEAPDEHYFCYVDVEKTQPFMASRSEHGTEIGGWAHEFGKGRICCLGPGHTVDAVDKMKPLIVSATAWCMKEK